MAGIKRRKTTTVSTDRICSMQLVTLLDQRKTVRRNVAVDAEEDVRHCPLLTTAGKPKAFVQQRPLANLVGKEHRG